MEACIARHKDESVLALLEDAKNKLAYSCSDPRLHIRARQEVSRFTEIATERHQEDFESLHSLIKDYIKDHHEIPYAVVLQLLAMRYLGARLLETGSWIVNIPTEVQRHCPVCFGTWVTGIVRFTVNVHFLNTWRCSDHTPSLILILNTDQLGIGLCTTISSLLPSRTSQHTCF